MIITSERFIFILLSQGKIAQNFVIEIEILPWNPDLKLALTKKTRIQPLFSNEENLYFIRRISGLYQVNWPSHSL